MLYQLIFFVIYIPFMILTHETGHVVAILLIGGRVTKFNIGLSKVVGQFKYPDKLTLKGFIFFTINGILFQLITSIIILISFHNLEYRYVVFMYLSVISINIVPFSVTDGAYILKAFPKIGVNYILWTIFLTLNCISILGLVFLLKESLIKNIPNPLLLIVTYLITILLVAKRILKLRLEKYDA